MEGEIARLYPQGSPGAVIALSLQGEILRWSRGAEQLFGYTAAEASGRTVFELIVPEAQREAEAQRLLETGQTGHTAYEALRRARSGELVQVDVNNHAVVDPGRGLRFIVSAHKYIRPAREAQRYILA